MKVLKKVLLAAMMASTLAAISTPASAEADKGRITYAPAEAIDLVASKIKVAIDAISTGASGDEADALVKAALDLSKEINANDKVDTARSKANNKLKSARKHIKESALQEAEQELRSAYKAFIDLKGLI